MGHGEVHLIEQIERLRLTTEEYRDRAPLAWAASMRLYGEKIADLVGTRTNIDPDAFEDRAVYLKHLLENRLISSSGHANLDTVRRVCNRIVHQYDDHAPSTLSSAWHAFSQLNEDKFWVDGRTARPMSNFDPGSYSLEELVEEFLNNSGELGGALTKIASKGGAFVKKNAVQVAGIAVGAIVIKGLFDHINSPEYQEEQRRKEQQRLENEERARRAETERLRKAAEERRKRQEAMEKFWSGSGLIIAGVALALVVVVVMLF